MSDFVCNDVQAKQHGDASVLDNMEVRRQLLAIQLRVLAALLYQSQHPQQPGESDEDRRALNEELIPALQVCTLLHAHAYRSQHQD